MTNSLEFLIGRVVDPFLSDEKLRSEYLNELSEKIKTQESTEIAMSVKLLTHRMLSPDQNEAANALNALDSITKMTGKLILEEINKLSALNAFIQLLSPEHQGTQTSTKNKQKACLMLFEWKNLNSSETENISKVYNMLRNRRIIESEPPTQQQHKTEDEERMNLLSRLLHSKKEEDLQKATEMIKKLDKMQGIELEQHLQDVIEAAKVKAQLLNDLLNSVEINQNGDKKLIYELFDHLISVRPTLFHWAVELASKKDQKLVETLIIIDTLNETIQRYKTSEEEKVNDPKINESPQVRFDPQSTKPDSNRAVPLRKPTPHAKMTVDSDYLKLFANSSKSNSPIDNKRLSNSSINEELDELDLNDAQNRSPSPNV